MRKPVVLITGASGEIGHGLIDRLERLGLVERTADSKDRRKVVVRVRDSGIGIESEMLPHIFEMFVQVGRHAARGHGGLGIGLSLVKTLVEMHGGAISATSAGPGLGSNASHRSIAGRTT